MPNSLKSRLKGLVRKGLLSEKDLSRIYTDNDVITELEKIKAEITEYRRKNNCGVLECLDIIDKEIKGAWQSIWRK